MKQLLLILSLLLIVSISCTVLKDKQDPPTLIATVITKPVNTMKGWHVKVITKAKLIQGNNDKWYVLPISNDTLNVYSDRVKHYKVGVDYYFAY